MSYDITLRYANDLDTTIDIGEPVGLKGNTYCPGGTELWYNLTYNYRPYFLTIFGEDGIYTLNNLTGKQSLPIITKAMTIVSKFNITYSTDPWSPQWGDVFEVLRNLLNMAILALDGVWIIV